MEPPVNTQPDPDWILALRSTCKATSQASVAKRLGISSATVSQLLNGTYCADTSRMEARIRGELLRETVTCPVMGEVSRRVCTEEQRRPYYPDPISSALYRACKTCPNAHRAEGASTAKEKK